MLVGWRGVYFPLFSVFQAEGNENIGILFTSSIPGRGI